MENHDQHGESHAHSDSVGKAQEESGQEAHQPDQLRKEKSVVGRFTLPQAGAQFRMENGSVLIFWTQRTAQLRIKRARPEFCSYSNDTVYCMLSCETSLLGSLPEAPVFQL